MFKMKIKKALIIFMIVVLFSAAHAGCGSRTMPVSTGNPIEEISYYIRSQYVMAERSIKQKILFIPQVMQESEEKLNRTAEIYKELMETPGLIRTFLPEDFYPEEIACKNVLENPLNGKEKPELLALYAEVGEEPEYLYYAEFDFNGDGFLDYITVYPYNAAKKNAESVCCGDIWIYRGRENGSSELQYTRYELPKLKYLTAGSWQEPEFFVMVLEHTFNFCTLKSIAAYADASLSEMALYTGAQWADSYIRVMAVDFATQLEISSGEIFIEERIYQEIGINAWQVAPVRLIVKDVNGEGISQVLFTERIRCTLAHAENDNIVMWDANEDGYEDILYYQGYDGGSGGIFDYYSLYNWSEEERQYVEAYFPSCTDIDYETHRVYSRGQSGIQQQIYEIYAVIDGEWKLYKRLDLMYEVGEVDQAVYYEWGEEIEVTDITGLSWEEEKALLEGKYPEFNFWREG